MSDGPSLYTAPQTDHLRSFREMLEVRDEAFLADLIEALSQECVRRGYPVEAIQLRDAAEWVRAESGPDGGGEP